MRPARCTDRAMEIGNTQLAVRSSVESQTIQRARGKYHSNCYFLALLCSDSASETYFFFFFAIMVLLIITAYNSTQILTRPTGCANKKNNPLGKIHYLSYCNRFFSPNLQLSQKRIQATYTANYVTIFAMV